MRILTLIFLLSFALDARGQTYGISRIPDANVAFSNNQIGDATTNRHGFMRALSGDQWQFLNGLGDWVPSGGAVQADAYASIQEAVTAAASIGTVELGARTYVITEPIVIGPNDTNSGWGGFVLRGQSAGTNGTQIIQLTAGLPAIVVTNTDHVTIDGIYFLSTNNTAGAIVMSGSTGTKIVNNVFASIGGGAGFAGTAVGWTDVNHSQMVAGNTFQNCGTAIGWTGTNLVNRVLIQNNRIDTTDNTQNRTGIRLGDGSTHFVINNTIESLRFGIVVPGDAAGLVNDVYISGNHFENYDQVGIKILGDGQITDCFVGYNYFNGAAGDWAIYAEGANALFGFQLLPNSLTPDVSTFLNLTNVTSFRWGSRIISSSGNTFDDFLMPSGITLPAMEFAAVKPSHFAETMSANRTFTFRDLAQDNDLNPNGGSYNFNPSGSFFENQQTTVRNSGSSGTVTFDSGGIAKAIAVGERFQFRYAGGAWRVWPSIIDGASVVLRSKKYLVLDRPHNCDGVGAVISTNDNTLAYHGQALFSGTAATNANFVEYRITVPEDLDTSVDLRVARWKVRLAGADTSASTYNIGMSNSADSSTYAGSPALWVQLPVAADAAGADGDVETSANVTLTNWKGNLAPGRLWIIRVNRDGVNDTSNVAHYSGPLVIEYGTTQ